MRRTIRILALSLAPAVALFVAGAALADPDVGCGAGTQVWEGNAGVAPKVLAATTNGSFGNQTFGITFGTLDCNQGGTVTVDAQLRMFADANLDRLAREMAQGEGEVLDALAHLLGIADADRAAFGRFTKAHFAEIFGGVEATSTDVLVSLRAAMAEDARFAAHAEI